MKPISSRVHTFIGLVGGLLLVFAPNLFGFTDNTAAMNVSIAVGLFIIFSELFTTSPSSPVKLIPMKVHIILDVLTGLFLAVSPWLFNFMNNDEPSQWVPHLVVGIFVVGYALLTSTADDRTALYNDK
jgi:hypothetical protein